MTEFEIKALPGQKFREAYVSPVDLLAIGTQVDFDVYKKNRELFKFSLEHIEAKVGEDWYPVKAKDRDVYMPLDIDKNLKALSQLCEWYFQTLILPVFQESAE